MQTSTDAIPVCVQWWAVLLNLYKLGRYFQLSPLSWRSPAKSVTAEVDWVTREEHTQSPSTQCSTPELRYAPCLHRHVRNWHRLAIWTRYRRFLHDLCLTAETLNLFRTASEFLLHLIVFKKTHRLAYKVICCLYNIQQNTGFNN